MKKENNEEVKEHEEVIQAVVHFFYWNFLEKLALA